MSPLRHFAYAIQWWCFAALALVIWAVMALRRAGAGGMSDPAAALRARNLRTLAAAGGVVPAAAGARVLHLLRQRLASRPAASTTATLIPPPRPLPACRSRARPARRRAGRGAAALFRGRWSLRLRRATAACEAACRDALVRHAPDAPGAQQRHDARRARVPGDRGLLRARVPRAGARRASLVLDAQAAPAAPLLTAVPRAQRAEHRCSSSTRSATS